MNTNVLKNKNDRPGGSFGTLNFIWNLILRPEMIP